MSKQEVILCESLEVEPRSVPLRSARTTALFILTDEQTHRLCMPQMREVSFLKDAIEITIGAGDVHKTLETLSFRMAEF